MLLSTIRDFVDLESGQFILDDLADEEIPLKKFKILIDRVLLSYLPHKPIVIKKVIHVHNECHQFLLDIPDFIPRCVPLSGSYSDNMFAVVQSMFNQRGSARQMAYRYEKPSLYITSPGRYDATLCYTTPIVKEIIGTDGLLTDYEYIGLEVHELMISLAVGHYLKAIGASRKLFRPSSTSIEIDVDLESKGQDLINSTMEKLIETNHWYLGST